MGISTYSKINFALFLFAGLSPQVQASEWSVKAFEQKAFIENKGQFPALLPNVNLPILYGAEDHGSKIFFDAQGLTYRFDVNEMPPESMAPKVIHSKEEEEAFEAFSRNIKVKTYINRMTWLNANPNPNIIVEDKTSDYYNYGKRASYAYGYKKLTYKNLYPNIDVEYTFHQTEGIKYALVLNPGADISKVKMEYTGADKIYSDGSGNIHISSPAGEVVDHAPITEYADDHKSIASSFQLNGNTVSFSLGSFSPNRKVIIDPWTTNPSFASYNIPMEIDVDKNGNVYVYGSDNPFKLRKYNSAGMVQWTYSSPWSLSSDWFGNLAVDSAGNSYITSGTANASIEKVSTLGINIFSMTGTAGVMEVFHLAFSKTQPNSIGLIGAQPPGACGCAFINTLTGVVSGINPISASPNATSENRGLCSSLNGNFYSLTTDNLPPNVSCLIGFSFTFVNVFTSTSGYGGNIPYNSPTYKGWTTVPGTQNSLAASRCYVYTHEGKNLKKWDATTGVLLASTSIASGGIGANSGTFADECNYVYVGTTTGVSKYDPSLSLIMSKPTAGYVSDVNFNYATGEIVACGNGFVASLQMNTNPCTPVACGAVPIELISFDGSVMQNSVRLIWTTGTEKDNNYFTIEKSKDGIHFITAGIQRSWGDANTQQHYQFIDTNPYSDLSYYRLKQTDKNGKSTYSGIKPILNAKSVSWNISNPIAQGEEIKVNLISQTAETVKISLRDLHGREVYSAPFSANAGRNEIEIDTDELNSGIYSLTIVSSNTSTVKKIIID